MLIGMQVVPQNSEAAFCTEVGVMIDGEKGGWARTDDVAAAPAQVRLLGVRSTHLYPAALM